MRWKYDLVLGFLWLAGPIGCAAGVASVDYAGSHAERGLGVNAVDQGLAFDPHTGEVLQKTRKLPGWTTLTSLKDQADAASAPAAAQGGEGAKRLMIYRSRFEVLVANIGDSITRFLKKVEDLGGYLEKRENDLVACRVPAASFKELSAEIRTYGLVVKESTQAEDVTKKYLDLTIRIENAEKGRGRLLALLEKAQNVEETLKIEAEVRRLTEEIERMKGELKYLSEQIAFSTLEVLFLSNAPEPRALPARTRSRFEWVNEIGVEHVLESF